KLAEAAFPEAALAKGWCALLVVGLRLLVVLLVIRLAETARPTEAARPAHHARRRPRLLLGDRCGHNDLVAPDDGRRPGDAGDGHFPANVFVGIPLARQVRLGTYARSVRPAELWPVARVHEAGQAQECYSDKEGPQTRHHGLLQSDIQSQTR